MSSHDRLLSSGPLRMGSDGLSSLSYKVLDYRQHRLYTNVTVQI